MILSASRRTDIPAYFSEWFINRIKAGSVCTRNPMNYGQISTIPLSPEEIDCIVFWTKDPSQMLNKLPVLDELGYRYYFQFTLTPYGKELEKNLKSKEEIIHSFCQLSSLLGKDRVLWRYDPILLNDFISLSYHAEWFEYLCEKLCEYTPICTISYVDLYTKLNKILKEDLIREITEEEMNQLSLTVSSIGRKYGVEIQACSETKDLTIYGIKKAACIDKDTIERICGYSLKAKPDKNQRVGCGCLESKDIGVYNTCQNGCIYCYANHSEGSIVKNVQKHNPSSDFLI